MLIPRPETEHLVAEAVDRAKQLTGQAPSQTAAAHQTSANPKTADETSSGAGQGSGQGEPTDEPQDQPWRPKPVKSFAGLTIADVGTGSGIIAVSLAKSLSGARIWALDVSKPALALATRNVENITWAIKSRWSKAIYCPQLPIKRLT